MPITKKQAVSLAIWGVLMTLSYVVHQFIFCTMGIDMDSLIYSLLNVYLFFGFFSVLLLFTVFQVGARNFDLVGMSFLVLTTLKMMGCFFLIRPILKSVSETAPIEKINFFVLFIVFLAIETLVTIVILNQNKENTTKSLDGTKK